MKKPSNSAANIIRHLNHTRLMKAFKTLCGDDRDRNGFVLAIATTDNLGNGITEFASVSIGRPGKKFGRYAKNAAEKIERLFNRREEGKSEIASSQSADIDREMFGGCIFFRSLVNGDVYISISGGPAEVDEALSFVIGEKYGFNAPQYKNPLIPEVRELLVKLTL